MDRLAVSRELLTAAKELTAGDMRLIVRGVGRIFQLEVVVYDEGDIGRAKRMLRRIVKSAVSFNPRGGEALTMMPGRGALKGTTLYTVSQEIGPANDDANGYQLKQELAPFDMLDPYWK